MGERMELRAEVVRLEAELPSLQSGTSEARSKLEVERSKRPSLMDKTVHAPNAQKLKAKSQREVLPAQKECWVAPLQIAQLRRDLADTYTQLAELQDEVVVEEEFQQLQRRIQEAQVKYCTSRICRKRN